MGELKIFENPKFGKVRVVERDGEPWFVAADVCRALDISNSRDAVGRLDEDEKGVVSTDTPGGKQEMSAVNEAGLYNLTLGSRKPEAKAFKRWVTHEVIPSIRKHGAYMTPETIEEAMLNPDFIIKLATNLKKEREARLTAERDRDYLLHSRLTYTSTELAKELGFRSAQELNKDLNARGIQYRTPSGTWVLYSKYSELGYDEQKQEVLDSGKVVYHRKWKDAGRDFLLHLYGMR